MVGVVQFAPQLLFSPTSGKWADTGNPARQILLGRVFCVAGSGLVAGWLFTAPSTHGTAAAVPDLHDAIGSGLLPRDVGQRAVAAIQERLAGAAPGQLSIAQADAGQVTLSEQDPAGRVTVPDRPRTQEPS